MAEQDDKAISKQAEAGNEANADYSVTGPVARAPVPQIPDPATVAANQGEVQGGERPAPDDVYDDVTIKDDGSRVGKGQKAPKSG